VSDRDFALETLPQLRSRGASVAAGRGDRDLDLALTNLVKLSDNSPRLLDHAAEAQPGRRRTGARQDRARDRRADRAARRHEGLPLAYAKDMQEDKEGAMDALAALSLSIAAMAGMWPTCSPTRRA